ncbi:PadR family transcriptional regulator [Yinghuangia aomiensis]
MANVWPATQSQVYGELGRLTDAGLLAVSAEGARGRKEYTITDPGRAELRTWLLAPEPLRPVRSEMLLRVFFLDRIAADQARAYLTAQGAAAEGARRGPGRAGGVRPVGRRAAVDVRAHRPRVRQAPSRDAGVVGGLGGRGRSRRTRPRGTAAPAGAGEGGSEGGTADRAAENQ